MKRFRGITRGRYFIATYIKQKFINSLNSHLLQEIGRQAVKEVLEMKKEEITAVPLEVVKETLEDTKRRVIYVDKETNEKWITFPKTIKDYLHYWVNVKFEELKGFYIEKLKSERKERSRDYVLAFYLYGKVYELYEQGLINSKTVLESLREVYKRQDELKPLRNKEYEEMKNTLGEARRVYLSFKDYAELRSWYLDLPIAKRKAVWVATHYNLLDRLAKIWYNIIYQNN